MEKKCKNCMYGKNIFYGQVRCGKTNNAESENYCCKYWTLDAYAEKRSYIMRHTIVKPKEK